MNKTRPDRNAQASAEKIQIQADMLANRVKKRFAHLHKRFLRQQIDVFRLYDWDIPEIRAVVDWYDGHLVVGEYTRAQTVPEWLPAMGRRVAEALKVPPENLHLKERRTGKQDGKRYARINYTNQKMVVRERDLKFYVNPWDYVDTGLFSDHRDTRLLVRDLAAGKDFLNLYCYTGAFSCYAARGGAASTTSVDRSETAIAWVKDNFALNGIDKTAHTLAQAHAFDFLEQAKKRGQTFDLAVVDPPSYSTTRVRGVDFDILRDHPALIGAVLEIMRKGGVVFFSTNHQDFKPRMDALKVEAITEITGLTIPEDYVRKRAPIHRCWRITV